MKANDLRKFDNKKLNKMLKDLDFELMKASSKWGNEKIKNKELGIKPQAKKGTRTSLMKNLRRTKAKILTILNERKENENR